MAAFRTEQDRERGESLTSGGNALRKKLEADEIRADCANDRGEPCDDCESDTGESPSENFEHGDSITPERQARCIEGNSRLSHRVDRRPIMAIEGARIDRITPVQFSLIPPRADSLGQTRRRASFRRGCELWPWNGRFRR